MGVRPRIAIVDSKGKAAGKGGIGKVSIICPVGAILMVNEGDDWDLALS